jgi:hypothetical protein
VKDRFPEFVTLERFMMSLEKVAVPPGDMLKLFCCGSDETTERFPPGVTVSRPE